MENLLSKSDENYEAFHLLKDAKKYSSCVHCAYYSAFQLTMHALTEFFGYSLEFLIGRNSDSHKIVKNEFCRTIKNKEDMFSYKRKMEKLTQERISADYKIKEFGQKETLKIGTLLDETRAIITKNSKP